MQTTPSDTQLAVTVYGCQDLDERAAHGVFVEVNYAGSLQATPKLKSRTPQWNQTFIMNAPSTGFIGVEVFVESQKQGIARFSLGRLKFDAESVLQDTENDSTHFINRDDPTCKSTIHLRVAVVQRMDAHIRRGSDAKQIHIPPLQTSSARRRVSRSSSSGESSGPLSPQSSAGSSSTTPRMSPLRERPVEAPPSPSPSPRSARTFSGTSSLNSSPRAAAEGSGVVRLLVSPNEKTVTEGLSMLIPMMTAPEKIPAMVYEALFDVVLRFSVVDNSSAYSIALDFLKAILQGLTGVAINLDPLHTEWLCNQITRKGELKKLQPIVEYFVKSPTQGDVIPKDMLAESLVDGINKHYQRSLRFAHELFVMNNAWADALIKAEYLQTLTKFARLNDNCKKFRRLCVGKLAELASAGLIKFEISTPEVFAMLLSCQYATATNEPTTSPTKTIAMIKVDIDLDI